MIVPNFRTSGRHNSLPDFRVGIPKRSATQKGCTKKLCLITGIGDTTIGTIHPHGIDEL
jgi:hypothetical protein